MRVGGPCHSIRSSAAALAPFSHPFLCALISLNLDSARSNLSLKSHIASRISPKVADVFARSACPKVKMLLLRKNPMIVGSEILYAAKLPDLRAALVGLG